MISFLATLTLVLSPGASVTAGTDMQFDHEHVSAYGRTQQAAWNRDHTVKSWLSGRVTFNGITFTNHSRARVTVRAREGWVF